MSGITEECVCCKKVDSFLTQEELNTHLAEGKTGEYWCPQCKPQEAAVEEVNVP